MKTKVPAAVAFLILLTSVCAVAQEPSPGKPQAGQIAVNVFGEVNKPGRYLLPEGATALDALGVAGGQSLDADLKQVRFIHATTEDKPSADKLDMRAVLMGTRVAPVLHTGDSLTFPRKFVSIVY